MTDRDKQENSPGGEDRGVRIEIHGEEPDVTEKKSEDSRRPEQNPGKEQAAEGFDGQEDAAKTDQNREPDEEPDRADASDAGEDTPSGSGTGTGKGFFGFKGRKEKDQRDQKIEELTDQVRRQMAEFDNFRKRTDREKATMFDMGKRDVIEQILPVVDSFERGLGDMKEESEDPFRQGMQKIYRQLTKALEELGVKPIEAVGKPFDPNYHNAVMHCEDESAGENIIVQEFQKGYMLNDVVIRHSMVKVAN